MRRPLARLSLLAALHGVGLGLCLVGAAPEALLRNGDLSAWEQGAPVGWTVEVGASNGEGEASTLAPGPEGGVRLQGGAGTKVWRLLRQGVDVPVGAVVRLRAEARVRDLARDPGQFQNAYVGLGAWRLEDGAFGGAQVDSALREVWTPLDVVGRVAPGVRAGPAVFLSQTGTLEARAFRLEVVPPEGSFDLLVEQVARHYSFLAQKGIDWPAHAAALRARALAATDERAFAAVAQELLGPLKDLHVTLRLSDGQVRPTFFPDVRFNVEMKALRKALGELTTAGRAGYVASLEGDLGYVAVTSLQGPEADHARLRLLARGLFEKQGLVVDLRGNGGGDERKALAFAALLADGPRVYARRRVRNGPLPGDLSAPEEVWVRPENGARAFRGPIVVLLGPGCVSSGEGLAQMLDVLPNVRTVGQPTLGASGNPQPLPLPNGLEVRFSRWVNEQADGSALEGRGVQPDVAVPHVGEGDPTLAAGLAELRRLLAAPPK